MRKREGFKEISIYLTEEQYADLERYWRFKTTHRFVTHAASELLVRALEEENESSPVAPSSRPESR